MARSRPLKRSQSQPESKKGLVIFLVFFILTTIGGGIFGYQGFLAAEGKDNTIKEKDSKIKAVEDDRQFYKYQALLYRRLMGQDKPADKADLDTMDKQFKEATEWANHKDRNEVKDLTDKVDTRLKLVVADKPNPPPVRNYEDALKFQITEARTALDSIKQPLKDKEDGIKKAADAEALRIADKDNYDKALKALSTKLETEQKDLVDQKAALQEELKQTADKFEKLSLEKAEVEKKFKLEVAGLTNSINKLNEKSQRDQEEIAKLTATTKGTENPDQQQPQIKSVGRVLERKGDSLFINLGLVQKVTPQTTFSIHAVGANGQPLPVSKGSLEVVNVFEAGSQARIMIEKSKGGDPIRQGDAIVNPNWNPDRQRHVAITGVADLAGEGRNQMRELRQILERQNVVVDAWLESTGDTWTPQGKGITRDTNYLILGDDLPNGKNFAVSAANLSKMNNDMLKQAVDNGVLRISLRNYLDLIGYQPTRGLGDAFTPRLGVVAPPEDKAPAAADKDKPKLEPKPN